MLFSPVLILISPALVIVDPALPEAIPIDFLALVAEYSLLSSHFPPALLLVKFFE